MGELEVQDHSSEYYLKRYSGCGFKYHSHIIWGMMRGIKGEVLDVGCGTGIISELYPHLDIMGADISRGMLKYHKGTYVVAPAEDLPFNSNSFDAVVCRSLLHHLPDCEAGLKEIKRVLKPGGKFVCWETNKSWLAEAVRRRTQHGDRFSEYHRSFSNLPDLVGRHFKVEAVKYEGFVAYPLYGFPDIIDFGKFIPFLFEPAMLLDEALSRVPFLNRLSFAVRIHGSK